MPASWRMSKFPHVTRHIGHIMTKLTSGRAICGPVPVWRDILRNIATGPYAFPLKQEAKHAPMLAAMLV